jgi:RNA polymerase sigma-70 factor, ECF subfamily
MRFSVPIPMAVAENDAEMVRCAALAQRGANRMDEAAFEAFYSETAAKFAGYLRRAARNPALAEDVFQEAFLRFLRTCPPGLDDRQQRAYLYRTGMSLLTDHWRRAKRERLWNLLTPFQEASPERSELGQDTKEVFAKLKPQEQVLLWMAYVEGFDHREIAAALQLAEKSVRVLLFRARKKMAGMLTAERLGPGGA